MSAQPAATREFALRVGVPQMDVEAEKAKIMEKVGPLLASVEVFGNRLLVAKLVRDKIGSLHRPESARREDVYQSKSGLVLAVGPLAFENDANNDFRSQRAKPGDWVVFHYSDGAETDIVPPGTHERVPAKIIKDVDVQIVTDRPDLFY